jgi:hypothetical protein
MVSAMPLIGIKIERLSALMNGVFMGVGIIFLIWGATDIIFPISDRMNVAVFGLTRILLGIISLGVGVGVEAVQWAKIGKEFNPNTMETPDATIPEPQVETTQAESE